MVKLNVRDRESIQEAVRRFRKLVERSGIKKEMRRKESELLKLVTGTRYFINFKKLVPVTSLGI